MENPFKYGSIVEGPYFADRVREIDELSREMENLSRVFLVSPRRLGKTCLLFNLVSRLRDQGLAVAYLDLNACPDLSSMAVSFTQASFRALESNVDKLLRLFSAFSRLRPRVSVGSDGRLSAGVEVSGDSGEGIPALLEGMRSAGDLAERKDRKLVVIIDEFSDLPKYNGESLEKALRSEIQLHRRVGYIFSGSEQSVMLELCGDPARAFYKMGRIMELGPIPRDAYGEFVDDWFQKAGAALGKDCVDRILELGEDVPYNIQRMCHMLWEESLGGKDPDRDLIESLPHFVARQESAHFELVWQAVSQQQKSLLMALANEPKARPFSRDFQIKYTLGPSSSIKASLESMTKKGVLSRTRSGAYTFADMFMRYWLLGLSGRGN